MVLCEECGVQMIKDGYEYYCPECGLVKVSGFEVEKEVEKESYDTVPLLLNLRATPDRREFK